MREADRAGGAVVIAMAAVLAALAVLAIPARPRARLLIGAALVLAGLGWCARLTGRVAPS